MNYLDGLTCILCGKLMKGTTRGRKKCGKCYLQHQHDKRKKKGLK
tara:strand:- start:149 stop:283 length:135 start_codon:yes stop_codon:yes gene_type:complete